MILTEIVTALLDNGLVRTDRGDRRCNGNQLWAVGDTVNVIGSYVIGWRRAFSLPKFPSPSVESWFVDLDIVDSHLVARANKFDGAEITWDEDPEATTIHMDWSECILYNDNWAVRIYRAADMDDLIIVKTELATSEVTALTISMGSQWETFKIMSLEEDGTVVWRHINTTSLALEEYFDDEKQTDVHGAGDTALMAAVNTTPTEELLGNLWVETGILDSMDTINWRRTDDPVFSSITTAYSATDAEQDDVNLPYEQGWRTGKTQAAYNYTWSLAGEIWNGQNWVPNTLGGNDICTIHAEYAHDSVITWYGFRQNSAQTVNTTYKDEYTPDIQTFGDYHIDVVFHMDGNTEAITYKITDSNSAESDLPAAMIAELYTCDASADMICNCVLYNDDYALMLAGDANTYPDNVILAKNQSDATWTDISAKTYALRYGKFVTESQAQEIKAAIANMIANY